MMCHLTRYWEQSHKYGIRLPESVDEGIRIDKESGTEFWTKAINKEMANVQLAFKILDEKEQKPTIRYQHIKCHMIFNIKFDFTPKARFITGGHLTKPPASLTYSTVISRESIRITFLFAVHNDLEILADDIGNADLNATCREKVCFTAVKGV